MDSFLYLPGKHVAICKICSSSDLSLLEMMKSEKNVCVCGRCFIELSEFYKKL